jgi:hypothetical protein
MPDAITVTGADVVQRRLEGMGRRALRQRPTFEREGRYAQRSIKGVPVATGRLARGVRGGSESVLEVTAYGYRVGTNVPYARYVFGGTKSMPARPPDIPRDLGRRAARAIAADLR